jgi:hypothetical protein
MSAPAASTLLTSSPRRAKSAERIDGAIHGAWRWLLVVIAMSFT